MLSNKVICHHLPLDQSYEGSFLANHDLTICYRFRVCSRATLAFCSNQILGDFKLRLLRDDPASSLATAKQDSQNLMSLRTNKKYQLIRLEVDQVCDFVTDHSKCLRDANKLLSLLKTTFYPSVAYLNI